MTYRDWFTIPKNPVELLQAELAAEKKLRSVLEKRLAASELARRAAERERDMFRMAMIRTSASLNANHNGNRAIRYDQFAGAGFTMDDDVDEEDNDDEDDVDAGEDEDEDVHDIVDDDDDDNDHESLDEQSDEDDIEFDDDGEAMDVLPSIQSHALDANHAEGESSTSPGSLSALSMAIANSAHSAHQPADWSAAAEDDQASRDQTSSEQDPDSFGIFSTSFGTTTTAGDISAVESMGIVEMDDSFDHSMMDVDREEASRRLFSRVEYAKSVKLSERDDASNDGSLSDGDLDLDYDTQGFEPPRVEHSNMGATSSMPANQNL